MSDLTMKGKQELIRAMNAGIISTNAKDVYSCGFRNGIRWCRALLEDDLSTLKFEDASQYTQSEQLWIPFPESERMPKDGKWYLFTDGVNMSVERYKEDALDHFFPAGRWFSLEDAIAWMPLPKQYRKGDV